MEDSGVKVPINIAPGGVDLGIFNPYREPFIPKEDIFRFLFLGKWEIRKGADIVCKAFADEFNYKEKVELMLVTESIKMFNNTFNIYKELLSLNLNPDKAPIRVIEGIIPNYRDMGRVYTSCDAFVSPTRGEGWNLPLIEAMASGLPSIATNWSAHTDYANKDNCYMLDKFELKPAVHPQQMSQIFLQFGKWAEPDIKEVREKMRYIFDNQEEAKKLGMKAMRDMKDWTWDCAAKKDKKYLEELL